MQRNTHKHTHMATHRHTHQNNQKEKMQHVHSCIAALVFKIRQIKAPSVKTLKPVNYVPPFFVSYLITNFSMGGGVLPYPIHFIRSKKLDWGQTILNIYAKNQCLHGLILVNYISIPKANLFNFNKFRKIFNCFWS